MKNTRLCGPDLVRVFAIMSIVLLHSISYTQSFAEPYNAEWFLYLYLRNLFVASVPLFLMLTGYLQRTKKFTLSYYRGIIPLYVSYFVISAISMVAYAVNGYITGNMDLTFATALFKIFNFSANGYAWYFEMYLGLFLLIPFLNMLYNGINTSRGKLIMIAILAFLTLLPDTVLGFSPYYNGKGGTLALNVLPDFFKSLYPLTYYYIGSFISEYKPKLSAFKRMVLFFAAPLVPATLIALFSNIRGAYAWYLFNGFQTVTVCVTAVAVFLALYDIDFKNTVLKKGLAIVSSCTFEIYLISYIVDGIAYTQLDIDSNLNTFIVALVVFVTAFFVAFIIRFMLSPINKGMLIVYDKLTRKSEIEL